ncbi:MAG: hypothetical protein AAGC56_05245 [Pseudomonadota bacterium]
MAVNRASGGSLSAGTWALVAMRAGLGLAAFALFNLGAQNKVGALATDGRYADLGDGLWPFVEVLNATSVSFEGALGVAPAAAAALLFGKLFLDAAGARLFALRLAGDAPGGFWRVVFREGWSWWWASFRVALIAAVLLAGGAAAVGAGYGWAVDRDGAPPTLLYRAIEAPAVAGGAALFWALFVGAIATWMRADMAVRDSKGAVPAAPRALGGLLRRPFAGLFLYVALNAAPLAIGVALGAWLRLAEPFAAAAALTPAVAALVIILQAFVWRATLLIAVRARARQLGRI